MALAYQSPEVEVSPTVAAGTPSGQPVIALERLRERVERDASPGDGDGRGGAELVVGHAVSIARAGPAGSREIAPNGQKGEGP